MRLVKLKGMKRINGLHFTPDGRRLLAVGGAEVRMQDFAVWIDVSEMAETLRIPMHAGCAAVSADCTRIAVGNSRPFLEPNSDIPPVAVFDATDPKWHEDESRWRTVIPHAGDWHAVEGLAFDPKGKRLAVSHDVTQPRSGPTRFSFALFPLGIGRSSAAPPGPDKEEAFAVIVFSPDGKRMAATGGIDGDESVAIMDARTTDRVRDFTPPGPQTRHLIFSPDGRTLAVVNAKAVHLIPSDSDVPGFTLVHPKQANATAFTPDGRRVLSTCHDGQLRIWDPASGRLLTGYDWGIGQTTAVAVSPDGLTAAVGGQKGQIAVFDLDG